MNKNVVSFSTVHAGRMLMAMLFVLMVSGLPGTVHAAVNLIQNAGFEVENQIDPTRPSGWRSGYSFPNAVTTYTYPAVGTAGTRGAEVTISSSTNPEADAKWLFNRVPVVQGVVYDFSNSYKATGPSVLGAELFDASGVHISFIGIKDLPASPDWTTAHATVVFPVGTAFATIIHSISSGTLTVDDYSLSERVEPPISNFSKGVVTFAFDDGWQTQYVDALPKLEAARIPASFYIITGALNGAYGAGYVSTQTILDIQNKGYEVAAHTVNHCDLVTALCGNGQPSTLSAATEITQSRNDLLAVGVTPSDTFVYPYGRFNTSIVDVVANSGFIAARTVERGYNHKNSDIYRLKTFLVGKDVTNAGFAPVKEMIDTAIADKTWLILTFHQIESAESIAINNLSDATTPEFFSQIVDYVTEKRNADQVVVKTMHDVVRDCVVVDEANCVNHPSVFPDTTAPVVTVVGSDPQNITLEAQYFELGASAIDNKDGDISTSIVVNTSAVNTHAPGTYTVLYTATDAAGNIGTTSRTVVVTPAVIPRDTEAPVVTVVGANPLNLIVGTPYGEQGATAVDTTDGTISGTIVVNASTVNIYAIGTYTVTYTATDAAGNTGSATRSVVVSGKTSSGGGGTSSSKSKKKLGGTVLGTSTSATGALMTKGFEFKHNLRISSRGVDVVELQKVLTAMGFYTGPQNGYFGPLTHAAVVRFQKHHGIYSTGLVGALTRAELNKKQVKVLQQKEPIVKKINTKSAITSKKIQSSRK